MRRTTHRMAWLGLRETIPCVLAFALATPLQVGRASAGPPTFPVRFEEKLLATVIPRDQGTATYEAFSPTGEGVAYCVSKGSTADIQFVVIGDKKGEEFEDAGNLRWSPDGKQVAYHAKKDGKSFVVVGDKKGEAFKGTSAPAFGPGGGPVVYKAWNDDAWYMVRGEDKGEAYDGVDSDPVFSPDGKHMAFKARRGKEFADTKQFVVLDGRKGEDFTGVGEPLVFSPDGAKLAYTAARDDGKPFLVVGDATVQTDGLFVAEIVFSRDGGKMATVAVDRRVDKSYVVVDGKKGEACDGVRELAFSPDGKRLAYVGSDVRAEKVFVVVDGQKGENFDGMLHGPMFSPDSSRVAYVASLRDKDTGNHKHFAVIDGVKSDPYDAVTELGFSPDGKQCKYVAESWTPLKHFLVVGDRKIDGEKGWFRDSIFGPDGTLAYVAAPSGGASQVVVGDRKSAFVGHVYNPTFSPDGKKIAYGAEYLKPGEPTTLWWKVMDVK